MLETWIVITLAAAVIQNARSVLQKRLTARLSVLGSTYARFVFGFPLAVGLMTALFASSGTPLPHPSGSFMIYALVGGAVQIVGNVMFIGLISFANFTISATYVKTETVLAALFSFALIGDVLSGLGLTGVLLTFGGCIAIASARQRLSLGWLLYAARDRAALIGLGCGAMYAVGSTCYRAATLSLDGGSPELNAIFTLAFVSGLQAALFGVWLAWREPAILRDVLRAWRGAVWIGVTGISASACWFTAFALQKTAYVLAVGQVEILLAYLTSRFLFKERITTGEMAGIAVTIAGILLVVLAR